MIMEDELDGEKERKWKRQRSNKWQSGEFTEQRAGFCELQQRGSRTLGFLEGGILITVRNSLLFPVSKRAD